MEVHGIIFDIKKFAVHDGPGIRTTVFFKGCPMNCWWCHNPESQEHEPELITKQVKSNIASGSCPGTKDVIGQEATVQEVMNELDKDQIFYDVSNGGITFSGGEPLMQPEFLQALLVQCKKRNYHITLDTAGYVSSTVLKTIAKNIDLFLYDIKLIDNDKHKLYTGVSNQPILDNLKLLVKLNKKIIIRIPVIPSINTTSEELTKIGIFLSKLKIKQVELLPFHKIGEEKYHKLNKINRMKDIKEPTKEEIRIVKETLEHFNLIVKIEE
ncbi:MAG: glycyl-radical enzyme activating protein [Candidatus Heimdallarchaeota archaeon]|nr:glycyl-radical enzyme activating protein [Candidatus Heimdallarchaeota archaeon]